MSPPPPIRCDGNLPRGDRTINRYFDTTCFVLTPLGTFGNSGRNIVQIPGLNDWDIALVKLTSVTERVGLQLRGELFNTFNHAQFNAPDLTTGNVTFGQINSARAARIVQFGLKLLW